jgi:hypothetical protein
VLRLAQHRHTVVAAAVDGVGEVLGNVRGERRAVERRENESVVGRVEELLVMIEHVGYGAGERGFIPPLGFPEDTEMLVRDGHVPPAEAVPPVAYVVRGVEELGGPQVGVRKDVDECSSAKRLYRVKRRDSPLVDAVGRVVTWSSASTGCSARGLSAVRARSSTWLVSSHRK